MTVLLVILLLLIAAALWALVYVLLKKQVTFSVPQQIKFEAPKLEIPPFPAIPKPEVTVNVAAPNVAVAVPEQQLPAPIVNVATPEIQAPIVNVTTPEPHVDVHVAAAEVPTPHVIVKLVPGDVDVHPSVQFPVQRQGVEILKLDPKDPDQHEVIGKRHATHPDVQQALDEPGLAVRWPSGEIDFGNQ
jgi:hypothetical protein